ncbi:MULTISPECIES: magnesium transporter [Shewanella]|uniref:Magnesium transporter MgtE n=1 Tax=Shewanella marisflavi TaxID=260364 RepID=A0AAC9XMR3_9GAMM|nr:MULTISPECIES: magnesium transporter [Shewanella]ASJ95859.1 magnesium transporter [Shewanella marisflavi]MCL1041844.1 magnesium transporter [Shewanella marisflavi]QDF74415.1 magnesium transporter [Shewanella marisflavi]
MTDKFQQLADRLDNAISQGDQSVIQAILLQASSAETARLLESLPPRERLRVWPQVTPKRCAKVLLALPQPLRRALIEQTDEAKLIIGLSQMEMDELADIDADLPIPVVSAMVQAMDAQRRQRYERVRDYPDQSAGGLMDVDISALRADVSIKAALRFLRRLRQREGTLPEHLDSLMVVDRDNTLLGIVPLSLLVSTEMDTSVREIMSTQVTSFTPEMPATSVAQTFKDKDLLSAPVVDHEHRLIGRITVDDVIDVIQDEADKALYSQAGLNNHPDMFAPIVQSATRRALWLGINLLTAFLAAWVIGLFEAAIEKIVALAVLMPVVASMGGVAGSQTLTLVTRGLALNQINRNNIIKLIGHEFSIGALNAILWASLVAVIALKWFGDWQLGLVFGLAMIIVLITGVLAGASIPPLLKRIGIDPALAGGVVLTTVTDVVGFFSFLGLATLLIL